MEATALKDAHVRAGARFAPFAGYEMPIQYAAGAVEEHRATRRSVGIFDIDHMGQIQLSGPGATAALSSRVSCRLDDLPPGRARYGLLLNDAGGIDDDLFLYRLEAEKWFVVANASNRRADYEALAEGLPRGVEARDLSDETYMLAVQGPRAAALLDALSGNAFSSQPRLAVADLKLSGVPVMAGRTGYTGEDGAELFFPAEDAHTVWDLLFSAAAAAGIEALPVGLAARDSLRFEAGMPLHGHEIGPEISPPEALLSWACDFSKDFRGKEAMLELKKTGLRRKLVTLCVSGGVPREGYSVLADDGSAIGRCVSGMFCPSVDEYAANAYVPPSYAVPGTRLMIEIRGARKAAEIAKRPLYLPAYRR